MNSFPREINAWKNDVARRLVGLRGAVNDIFLGMPQIPDPEIGMPFSGPLSPVPFVWPLVDRSGGTPNTSTGGTPNTGGTLVTGCFTPAVWTVAASGFHSSCGGVDLNRTWFYRRNAAIPCSRSYNAREEESGSGGTIWGTLSYNIGLNQTRLILGVITYAITGDQITPGVSFTASYLSGTCTSYPASLTANPV